MKDKILTFFTIALFAGGIGTVGWVFVKGFLKNKELVQQGEMTCVTQRADKIMQDEFMKGTLGTGENFQVMLGYYKCNPVQRGELVYFRASPPTEAVVKRVRGLPGDKFEVLETATPGQFNLKINGELLKTGEEAYYFIGNGVPPLKTYELARQGVLGANEYILLSDIAPGASDSASLGIIKITAFEGKVDLEL